VIRNSVDRATCLGTVASSISAPSTVCSGLSYSFSLSNWQAGSTWNVSPNLRINGANNHSSVSVIATGNGGSWISVNRNGTELARYNFTVHTRPTIMGGIIGSDFITTNSSTYYYVSAHSSLPAFGYRWSLSGGSGSLSPSTTNSYVYAIFRDPTAYYLDVEVHNACGSSYASRYLSAGFMKAYPNPVSDVLHIEIDRQAMELYIQESTQQQGSGRNISLSIRLLDGLGTVHRQATSSGENIIGQTHEISIFVV
jgi:hypothetical protein